MNVNSTAFQELFQKLEQKTPNTFIIQDDQNEWSQYGISTSGSTVATFLAFSCSSLARQGLVES